MEILSPEEAGWVHSLARHSAHPLSVRICRALAGRGSLHAVSGFAETAGGGIEGSVDGHLLRLGSQTWLAGRGEEVPQVPPPAGSLACLVIDGRFRGVFVLGHALRPDADRLLLALGRRYDLALLSGDNEKERRRFQSLFGTKARLHFNQSPLDKLGFIAGLQRANKIVMMVGDGLNDAGALKQSDVGVAVVEKVGSFSPASDVILAASQVPGLFEILTLARQAVRVVYFSFGISALYNLVGISIAALGILSPLICAILMPLSSISVVLFACAATRWVTSRCELGTRACP